MTRAKNERRLVAYLIVAATADEVLTVRTADIENDQLAAIVGSLQELQTHTSGPPTPLAICDHVADSGRVEVPLEFIVDLINEQTLGSYRFDEIHRHVIEAAEKARVADTLKDGLVALKERPAEHVLSETRDSLAKLESDKPLETSFKEAGFRGLAGLLEPEKKGTIKTGFEDLDRRIVGLRPTTLSIIAARPRIGKTSLAMQIMSAAIDQGIRPLFHSLEMNISWVACALAAYRHEVSLFDIENGLESIERLSAVEREIEALDGKIIVDDVRGISIDELERRARSNARRHGVGLIVIDYLQKLHAERRTDSRHVEIGVITDKCRALALELDVPVLAVAQANRNAEGQRPKLSDLRESSSIEQDADLVLLLNRNPDEQSTVPLPAEIVIAKNRRGPSGIVQTFWEGPLTRYLGKEDGERRIERLSWAMQGARA